MSATFPNFVGKNKRDDENSNSRSGLFWRLIRYFSLENDRSSPFYNENSNGVVPVFHTFSFTSIAIIMLRMAIGGAYDSRERNSPKKLKFAIVTLHETADASKNYEIFEISIHSRFSSM